jgi:hypothetical protein
MALKSEHTIAYQTEIAVVANKRFPGLHITQKHVEAVLSSWNWMTKQRRDAKLKEYENNADEFAAFLAMKKSQQSK